MYTHNNKHQPPAITDESSEVIGQFALEPGQQSSFLVGIFESPIPEPDVSYDLEPKTCKVDSSLVRADERGDYKLTYYFRNIQTVPCTITVRTAFAA